MENLVPFRAGDVVVFVGARDGYAQTTIGCGSNFLSYPAIVY